MTETIAWVINRFDQMGGGERLIQEGARYYRSIGYRVLIVTWHYDDEVLFNGNYEKLDIVDLGAAEVARANIFKRAWSRAFTLPRLRKVLVQHNVSRVFVQGEYDVALAYMALAFSEVRYRFLIFGQMFQYPHDSAKYALVFRRHLREIVASCKGYSDTVPLEPPRLKPLNRLANEVISLVRWFAVRRAERRFVFSRQLAWETRLLFGADTIKARGAFRAELLNEATEGAAALKKFGLVAEKYLLTISRLDRKKRIDVIIEAFAAATIHPDMVLVVGGGGADEQYLRQIADRSGVAERIRFLGRVDENDLMPLKQGCAVFLSMDIGDYDISPLEALAAGRPVICPTEFDLDDTVRACQSFHVCEADPKTLAVKIATVLTKQQPDCREMIKALSWEAYFDMLNSD